MSNAETDLSNVNYYIDTDNTPLAKKPENSAYILKHRLLAVNVAITAVEQLEFIGKATPHAGKPAIAHFDCQEEGLYIYTDGAGKEFEFSREKDNPTWQIAVDDAPGGHLNCSQLAANAARQRASQTATEDVGTMM